MGLRPTETHEDGAARGGVGLLAYTFARRANSAAGCARDCRPGGLQYLTESTNSLILSNMSTLRSELRVRAESVRRFNRFYTKQIGVLHEHLLQSQFSLTEMRVLYELAQRPEWATAELATNLDVDAGYLSRILRTFEDNKLIRRKPSPSDARQNLVALTSKSRRVFQPLDERSTTEVAATLGRLASADQERLLAAMQTIERLFVPDLNPAF